MSLADQFHSSILKNSVQWMRYEAGIRQDIDAMIRQLGKDLVEELSGSGIDTPRTDWQRARLRKLLDEAQSIVDDSYTQIAAHASDGLAAGIEASTANLLASMNDAVGVELLQGIKWSPGLLKALVDDTLTVGAPSAEWWARQGESLTQGFTDQMRQAMLQGENLQSMVARTKDLMMVGTRNAEALVRTSAMAVNNAAQLALWKENANSLDELQWVATLDPKTCLVCGVLDGQTWPINDTHEVPPAHWNCRCCTVPIPKMWDELGIKMPVGQRPTSTDTANGTVSGDTTWESWLGSLSKSEQESILGPGRFRLWNSGKLSIRDLTDQRGNVLTLDQLKAL